MIRLWTLFAMLACVGCGSGSTAIIGSLAGNPQHAGWAIATYSSDASAPQQPDLLLSTRTDMCELLQAGTFVRETDVLEVVLYSNTAVDMVPDVTGSYPVVQIPNPPSNPALSSTVTAGATGDTSNCLDASYVAASGGSVVITDLGSSTEPTVGTFEADFAVDGKLAGYFFAVPCVIPAAVLNNPIVCGS